MTILLSLDTVETAGLARTHAALGVVPAGVVVRDGEGSAPPTRLTVAGQPEQRAHLLEVNSQRRDVAALQCHFVRDVGLCGSGYAFHGDRLLVDGSHLSDVAVEWVRRPMADSPRAAEPAREIFVRERCIVAVGPGHLIYGHWLVDFLPRMMIAREALGASFATTRIALPHDTPGWALTMLKCVAGVERAQCLFFERGVERLAIEQACIPSYGHTDYFFHSFCSAMFDGIGAPAAGPATRKLCLSRAGFERHTHGARKLLLDRERFEAAAVAEGYEIVQPELLPFLEQVALFRTASHVVGEYGSGLHSTVFSPRGTKTGFIRCPNPIQMRIGALRGQDSVLIMPGTDRVGDEGVQEYAMDPASIGEFFEMMR